MALPTCYKCGQQFTEEDKAEGNYRQTSTTGEWHHIRCPGKKVYWEETRDRQVREFMGLPEPEEEAEADPPSWIVRKRK